MRYSVYILKCADGTLYCGSTTDVARRLHAHNSLTSGAKYTRARRPVILVYTRTYRTFARACAGEAEIKRLTRIEKEILIADSQK